MKVQNGTDYLIGYRDSLNDVRKELNIAIEKYPNDIDQPLKVMNDLIGFLHVRNAQMFQVMEQEGFNEEIFEEEEDGQIKMKLELVVDNTKEVLN